MIYSSVAVTRNEDFVSHAIESLLGNSQCAEYIIVFDGMSIRDEFQTKIDKLSMFYNVTINVLPGNGLDVYGMFNLGVSKATKSHVLLYNDDMYFSVDFDKYLDNASKDAVITFQVVEPGYVDVNDVCIKMSFGETIKEFDEEAFENYAQAFNNSLVQNKLGWYMPVLLPKELFNKIGQYPTYPPFPYPNDIILFNILERIGSKFEMLNTVVYHFQRLSQRVSGTKLNLCCGAEKLPGYINVDFDNSDRNMDLSNSTIDYADNSFTEIQFRHGLEHFRFEIGEKLLKEIHRILKPDGKLHVMVPNLALACQDYLNGVNKFSNCAPAINRIYGLNTSELQIHKAGYRTDSLVILLKSVGFGVVEAHERGIYDEIYLIAEK